MHLLHKSLWQQTRDRQVEERQREIFFYQCYFNISHIQTELSISEPLPTKEHDEAVLRGTICGKYKRNHIFQLPPHQLRMLFVRLGTLFENDPNHRKRDRAGSESSHLYTSFELWDDAERCFCFRRPDLFSAKLVFIIPGWAQTGRRCQWLTQNVDFKFLHIFLSAIMKS